MERAAREVGREAKREFRKRGSARRELDLHDLVLDLPPPLLLATEEGVTGDIEDSDVAEDEDEEDEEVEELREEAESVSDLRKEGALPELPPPRVVSEAEKRIVEKHRELADRRHQKRVEEQQTVRREAKQVKNIKRTAAVRAKSIKIKYRRIPSNKARLIYTDVIAQVIKDYLRASSTVEKYVSDIIEELHDSSSTKGRKKRGPRKKKGGAQTNTDIAQRAKSVLKEYYERINEYFTSLIDLQLSNSLIRSDLERINAEKNKLRMQIFELRKERGAVGLEIKEARDEFRKLSSHFSLQDKHYKQLITLKEGGLPPKKGQSLSQDQLMDEINCKLDKYDNSLDWNSRCLKSIMTINKLLSDRRNE